MTKRIISAALIVLVFIPFLLIGGLPFKIFATIIACMGLYELIHIRETRNKFPIIMKLIAYCFTIWFTMNNSSNGDFTLSLDYKTMSMVIFFFISPIVFINNSEKYNIQDALFLVGSVLFIGLSFNLIAITRDFDLMYLIYLFLITTITDTFALFTGMLIGKHKLTTISPKKTVEGLLGGTFMGTFIPVAFYHTVINPGLSLAVITLATIFLSLVGQVGDLVFSAIKRYYDKKDFSDLIPGHGGILDRFDSMIFVVLAFILLLGII